MILILTACDPKTTYTTQQMSLDLNGCITSSECSSSIYSQTQLGCYVTEELNERRLVRRNRFTIF